MPFFVRFSVKDLKSVENVIFFILHFGQQANKLTPPLPLSTQQVIRVWVELNYSRG